MMGVKGYVDGVMTLDEKVRWLVGCAVAGDSIDVVAREVVAVVHADYLDGPSDAEVEAGAQAIYALDWGNHPPEMNAAVFAKATEQAKAALTAARQAREEKKT